MTKAVQVGFSNEELLSLLFSDLAVLSTSPLSSSPPTLKTGKVGGDNESLDVDLKSETSTDHISRAGSLKIHETSSSELVKRTGNSRTDSPNASAEVLRSGSLRSSVVDLSTEGDDTSLTAAEEEDKPEKPEKPEKPTKPDKLRPINSSLNSSLESTETGKPMKTPQQRARELATAVAQRESQKFEEEKERLMRLSTQLAAKAVQHVPLECLGTTEDDGEVKEVKEVKEINEVKTRNRRDTRGSQRTREEQELEKPEELKEPEEKSDPKDLKLSLDKTSKSEGNDEEELPDKRRPRKPSGSEKQQNPLPRSKSATSSTSPLANTSTNPASSVPPLSLTSSANVAPTKSGKKSSVPPPRLNITTAEQQQQVYSTITDEEVEAEMQKILGGLTKDLVLDLHRTTPRGVAANRRSQTHRDKGEKEKEKEQEKKRPSSKSARESPVHSPRHNITPSNEVAEVKTSRSVKLKTKVPSQEMTTAYRRADKGTVRTGTPERMNSKPSTPRTKLTDGTKDEHKG
jgi:hypothetical protein